MFFLFLLFEVGLAVSAANPPLECPRVLLEQELILTAAVEGWALAAEPVDGGESQLVRKVYLRAGFDSADGLLERRFGSPRHIRPRVSLTGQIVFECSYGPGHELPDAALNALRADLVRCALE